jgi:hypothetical protein
MIKESIIEHYTNTHARTRGMRRCQARVRDRVIRDCQPVQENVVRAHTHTNLTRTRTQPGRVAKHDAESSYRRCQPVEANHCQITHTHTNTRTHAARRVPNVCGIGVQRLLTSQNGSFDNGYYSDTRHGRIIRRSGSSRYRWKLGDLVGIVYLNTHARALAKHTALAYKRTRTCTCTPPGCAQTQHAHAHVHRAHHAVHTRTLG